MRKVNRAWRMFFCGAALAGAGFVMNGDFSRAADEPASSPAAPTVYVPKVITTQSVIRTMENYFADIYAKPLRIEKDGRLAHLIASVSLTRIDSEPTTRVLFVLADRGTIDPILAQMGWEGLHARYKSLSPEQRVKWITHGLAIARNGGFPGETAAPLIAALTSEPLQEKQLEDVAAFLVRVAEENDPNTEFGRRTLESAATAIANWSETAVVKKLITAMARSKGHAKRIDIMLSKLPGRPATPANIASLGTTLSGWIEKNPLPKAEKLAEYTGTSDFFSAPEKIENPHDEKWKGEAEIGDLRLSQLDFVVCVDATGSMAESNEFVFAYLEAAVKSLSVVTSNLRAGAVYYRHENMPEVMVKCCADNASKNGPNDFLVRTIPLTANFNQLVAQMKTIVPDRNKGHDGGGGAYYSAMANAVKVLGPVKEKNSAQVIAIVGDTNLTKGSNDKVLELAEKTGKAGYKVTYVVKNNGAARAVEPASMAVSGKEPVVYQPDIEKMRSNAADPLDGFDDSAFGKMVKRTIASCLPKEYEGRVDVMFHNVWKIIHGGMHAAKAKAAIVKE
jgi:hypothetical protein